MCQLCRDRNLTLADEVIARTLCLKLSSEVIMMMNLLPLLVTINFMLLLLTTSIVSHPLTNMPMSAEDADITSFFPTNADHKFPIGGLITSLCHFSNEGLSNYNITAIMGSLNAPYDFKHHFQNYSYKSFNYIVKSGTLTVRCDE